MKKTDLQLRGSKTGAVLAILMAVLVLLFPVTVRAEGELQVTEITAQGEITTDVNVRKGPSTDYDKLGTVRAGETLPVTGETKDGWYRVTYDGQEGYIYGKYMSVQQTETPSGEKTDDGEAPGEPEEEEGEFSLLKLVAIVFIIIVIIIMIFLTIRSMRQTDDEDDDDYEDEDDAYAEDEDDEDDSKAYETEEDDEVEEDRGKEDKPYVLREEDYQLHIDPKYFEDEPVPQPECVTGYLKKKQEEEELEKKKEEEKASSGDLQKAMDKLQELQEEIEKLKKNSKE